MKSVVQEGAALGMGMVQLGKRVQPVPWLMSLTAAVAVL